MSRLFIVIGAVTIAAIMFVAISKLTSNFSNDVKTVIENR